LIKWLIEKDRPIKEEILDVEEPVEEDEVKEVLKEAIEEVEAEEDHEELAEQRRLLVDLEMSLEAGFQSLNWDAL
jgi:methionine-rich copper-binding protein CopC